MPDSDDKPWLPAKSYGWGWGLPVHWKGWVFFIGWLTLFVTGARFIVNTGVLFPFWLFVVLMIVLLLGVCWTKGEKPGWRWGDWSVVPPQQGVVVLFLTSETG